MKSIIRVQKYIEMVDDKRYRSRWQYHNDQEWCCKPLEKEEDIETLVNQIDANYKEYYQGEVSVRAMKKYREKEGIKTVRFDVRAGSKEALEEEAKRRGLSVAQLIVDSVNAYVGREIIANKKQ